MSMKTVATTLAPPGADTKESARSENPPVDTVVSAWIRLERPEAGDEVAESTCGSEREYSRTTR